LSTIGDSTVPLAVVSAGLGTVLHAIAVRVVVFFDWGTLGLALGGPYLVYGEFPLRIASHILHSLIIYLMQQSINLRLDQRALKTTLQDEIFEELDEAIQAMFATVNHFLHSFLHL
jgi:hypothetical protein